MSDLRDVVLRSVYSLAPEEVSEWEEIHRAEKYGSAVNWWSLPRWTEAQRSAISAAIHDWCLEQPLSRALREVFGESRRVGSWLVCAAARSVASLDQDEKDLRLDLIRRTEMWVLGDEDWEKLKIAIISAGYNRLGISLSRSQNASQTSTWATYAALSAVRASVYSSIAEAGNVADAVSRSMSFARMEAGGELQISGGHTDTIQVIAKAVREAIDNAAIGYEKDGVRDQKRRR